MSVFPFVETIKIYYEPGWQYQWQTCTVRITDNDPKRNCISCVSVDNPEFKNACAGFAKTGLLK
jgi:hypothetical protein